MSIDRSASAGIELAPLRLRHALFCWQLANDPVTRRASFDSAAPTIPGHLKWMWSWSVSSGRLAWVILTGARKAGVVRAHRESDEVVLSVALMPWARGRGLGTASIRQASTLANGRWGKPIVAYIKQGNDGSVRAFAKSGYIETAGSESSEVIRMVWDPDRPAHGEEARS